MHKHKTAGGRIVIHIHPYNLSNDPDAAKHHQSETEIHLLDVIFQGSYTQPSCLLLDFSLALRFETAFTPVPVPFYTKDDQPYAYLRGPPTSL
ncbi:hypothetical protein ACFOET_14830 [Parapedobacter deserti]|uniref:Uncharacterized protein n=2 Tax=Parapedobacter deserti TaxID=1912957 RepID=A0ABV7JPQ3_9SPHI